MQNDMILSIEQEGLFSAINVDGKLFIGDTYLRKYIPIYIYIPNEQHKQYYMWMWNIYKLHVTSIRYE